MSISTNLHVIAAICGNFYQESTVNPGIWEGLVVGNPGYGLGQWTDNPPVVMRRTALFDWLNNNSYPQDSGEGQLKFLVHENIWIPQTFTQSQYNTLTEFFNSTDTSTARLVEEFMYHWEGINDSSYNTRLDYALHIYNILNNPPSTRKAWYSGNYYLDNTVLIDGYSACDWNSLLVYDFFTGNTPEPPEPGELTNEEILAIFRKIIRKKKNGGVNIVL